LLGMQPEEADPSLGYIEPGDAVSAAPDAFRVAGFREKPSRDVAAALQRRGAMWNSFVMVFAIDRMIELLRRERAVDVALAEATLAEPALLREAYATLPAWNFSSGFLSRIPEHLLV